MSPPRFIAKPLGDRMKELLRALMVLRDAIYAVSRGERHQMLPIFGLLRALLAEKSRANKPLLLDLASVLGKDLYVYAVPGIDEDDFPKLSSEPILRVGGLPVSLFQTNPRQRRLSIEQFLAQRMLVYGGRYYTRHEVIKLFAEKAGGAHFPDQVPADFAAINALEVGGEPAIYNALLQLGGLTLAIGVDLLRQLCDFSIYFSLVIPSDGIPKQGVLFDAAYPNTAMRIWLAVSPFTHLSCAIVGIDGFRVQAASERLLDRSRPTHITVRHHITEGLTSVLQLEIDGEIYAETAAQHPVFVTHDLTQYRRFVNRSQEDADAGLAFGFLEHFAFAGTLSMKDRMKLASYLDGKNEEPDGTCLVFQPGSYGETPSGQRNMQMTGRVVQWTWKRLVAGSWPREDDSSGEV